MRPGRGSIRIAIVALAAGVAWGVAACPAGAAVTTSASCTPTTITFPGSTAINCTLNVQTGPAAERFSVAAKTPQFGGSGPLAEGPTISQRGGPSLAGPGTFLGGGGAIPSTIACSTVGGNHGSFDGSFFGSYEIPANTATSFTMKFATGDPPWPGDSLAPTFVLGRDVQSPSLQAAIEVPTAEPVRQGPSGVQIAFATRPATPVLARAPQATFKTGTRIKLFGSTNPVVRNQKLRIFTVVFTKNQKGRPKPVTLAKVRTDANGRFAYKDWRPDKSGFYEVGITYRSQRAFLTDDFACSRGFELTK